MSLLKKESLIKLKLKYIYSYNIYYLLIPFTL